MEVSGFADVVAEDDGDEDFVDAEGMDQQIDTTNN